MDDQQYAYSGKTWRPCTTEDSGNSFFHAAFGVRVDDTSLYADKQANFKRSTWSGFLRYFENEDRPAPLVNLLNICFLANSKDIEADYDVYVKDVASQDHRVLVEEIPILAAIENMRIVLFIPTSAEPKVFEPSAQLLGSFPYMCPKESREVVIRLRNSHFERLFPYVQQTQEDALQQEIASVEESTRELMQYVPNKRYTKGGSAGIQGSLYQINLLSVLLLKGMTLTRDWYLSTEDSQAGKFDDAVFQLPEEDVLIQAKHKEKVKETISYEALLSSSYKHNLNIAKYFTDFLKIKNKFKKNKLLVICTNVAMGTDEKLKAIIKEETVGEDHLLYFKNAKNVCYSFNREVGPLLKDQLEKSSISDKFDDDVKNFLSVFRIFTNFLDKENWKTIALEAVSQIPLAKNFVAMQTFEYLRKQVSNWFQAKPGPSIYMRMYEAKALLCDMYSLKCVDSFKQYNITWEKTDSSFCLLKNNLTKSEKQVLHFIPQQEHILSAVKTIQVLQDNIRCALFLNNSESSMVQEHFVGAFIIPHYVYLVIVSPARINKELVQGVLCILQKYRYKKVIVIADADNEFVKALKPDTSFVELRDVITFEQISAETTDDMRKKSVVFQGRAMNLEDVVGVNAMHHTVDDKMLARLSKKGENIVVGGELKHSDEDMTSFYIYRSFSRGEEHISEEQMLQSGERVVLISDIAGMGKTTVLDSLAIAAKDRFPHLWVIRIELNNYSTILGKCLKGKRLNLDLLQLLDSFKGTQFKSEFERRLFQLKDKVVLMVDGIDEINSNQMEMVVATIEGCNTKALENIAKIFVTTRPHLCNILETKLKVTAYNLVPFSKDNQKDFLTRYWTRRVGIQEEAQKEICQHYAKALIKKMSQWIDKAEDSFAGVPLQTRMLAEVFQERTNEESQKWQRCKEFLSSNDDQPSLPDTINLIQLYEMFIEKKQDIFVHEKCKANHFSEPPLINMFNQYFGIYQVLALQVLFHRSNLDFISTYKNRQKNLPAATEEYISQIGIVQYKEGQPHFIHITLAEYYAAECLWAELKSDTSNQRFKKFFLTKLLKDNTYYDKYYVIRVFMKGFRKRDWLNMPCVQPVWDDLMNYETTPCSLLLRGDSFRRYIVGEDNVDFQEFFLTCALYVITSNTKSKAMLAISNFYLITTLHVAAARGHLIIVKELVASWATINLPDDDGNTLLHAAALNGHADVVEFLVQKGAPTTIINRNGETAVQLAGEKEHFNVVTFLTQQMAAAHGDIKHTPIMRMALYGENIAIAKFLQKINTTDSNCSTALHVAAQERHLNALKDLLVAYIDHHEFIKLLTNNTTTDLETTDANDSRNLQADTQECRLNALKDFLVAYSDHYENVKLCKNNIITYLKTTDTNGSRDLHVDTYKRYLHMVEDLFEEYYDNRKFDRFLVDEAIKYFEMTNSKSLHAAVQEHHLVYLEELFAECRDLYDTVKLFVEEGITGFKTTNLVDSLAEIRLETMATALDVYRQCHAYLKLSAKREAFQILRRHNNPVFMRQH